jgi:putative membrane protein
MNPSEERKQWLSREPNPQLSKKLKVIAWILTGVVFIIVGLMRQPDLKIPLPEGVSMSFLPPIHAIINTIVTILLIAAVVAVKRGRILRHRQLMLGAMAFSVLFLLGYVAYHFTTPETIFGDTNHDGSLSLEELQAVAFARPVYMALLITHIIAAAVSLPLILLTFISAWTNRFEAHRSMARWVFPVWLYVAITGPICYLMLRPYYL